MNEIAFFNGAFLPLSEARVSVEDRGFQFADGIYEVIRVYNGKPFYLVEHLERLERSAKGILLTLPYTIEEFVSLGTELIARSELKEAMIYIQITRGAYRRQHHFPPGDVPPTVVMFVREVKKRSKEQWEEGVELLSLPDERWLCCEVKSVSLLPNVIAKEKAHRAGAFEAVLYRDNEIVTEGSSSNCYYIKNQSLYTHPPSKLILSGITRSVILKLAVKAGLVVNEEPQELSRFKSADEVFMSSTTMEIMPVRAIDGYTIAGGNVPGAYTRKLQELYTEEVKRLCT